MTASPPSQFFVERAKISSYLLDSDHPDGKSKANFFIGWGFDPARPNDLTAALLDHPTSRTPCDVVESVWGVKFIYEGALVAPNGTTPPIRTVLEVRFGEAAARLVTAYRF